MSSWTLGFELGDHHGLDLIVTPITIVQCHDFLPACKQPEGALIFETKSTNSATQSWISTTMWLWIKILFPKARMLAQDVHRQRGNLAALFQLGLGHYWNQQVVVVNAAVTDMDGLVLRGC